VTVEQLIEALRHFPPDTPVLTHASNHSSSRDDTHMVSLATEGAVDVVLVGNWTAWTRPSSSLKPHGVVFQVDRRGKLVRGKLVHHPARRERSYEMPDIPARSEFVEDP